MATKLDELSGAPGSVLKNCSDDEPLFILRSQDVLAVRLVNIWIQLADLLSAFGKQFNIKTIPEEKVQGAIKTRDMMLNWQATNHEKMKLPD